MSHRVGVPENEKEKAIQEIKRAMKGNKDLRIHERSNDSNATASRSL